jgi:protein ImuB
MKLGLHPGMKLAHAQAMVPGLRVVRETPQADADALADLAAWCLRYTPLTRALPPDGIWLDVTGCAQLHGGELALLSDLATRLQHAGLSARVALADTPGAAHALAHYAAAALTIAPGGVPPMLLALPVEALRLESEAVILLHRFGLRDVGALAALPRAPLARRLGAGVARRLDQALGRVSEPIEPTLPEMPIAESLAFPEPLLTGDALSAATAHLARTLCERLETRGQGARRLELVFQRVDGSRQVQRVALARPSHAVPHIARLFDERLEQVNPGEGIEAMTLTAVVAEALRPDQAPLHLSSPWSDPGPDHGLAGLAPLIDRLGNRLGARRLWRPVPVQSDVPERSVRAIPPLDLARLGWPAWPAALPRPVRLFDPPMPVRTLTTLPDHPPSFFVWRNHRHSVRRADGPERIAGEWWQRPGELLAVRDYFRLEDETGRRFWLFRRGDGTDAATGDLSWFLHGLF